MDNRAYLHLLAGAGNLLITAYLLLRRKQLDQLKWLIGISLVSAFYSFSYGLGILFTNSIIWRGIWFGSLLPPLIIIFQANILGAPTSNRTKFSLIIIGLIQSVLGSTLLGTKAVLSFHPIMLTTPGPLETYMRIITLIFLTFAFFQPILLYKNKSTNRKRWRGLVIGLMIYVSSGFIGVCLLPILGNRLFFEFPSYVSFLFIVFVIFETIRTLEVEKGIAEDIQKTKSLLMSSVTHELRTPLTAIESAINILNDELLVRTDFSPKEKQYIHMIRSNAHRLDYFIDNLLKTAQLENKVIDLSLQRADLNETLKDAIHLCQPLADKKNLKIRYAEIPGFLISVDHEKFKQVFTNLISNAIKYSEVGSIEINLHQDASSLSVVFSDEGEGIPAEHLENIFQPFVQVSSRIKKSGVGLGLYIADKITGLHGGDITVHSKGKGHGTTFTVNIPNKT